jgi:hypothetical protein
MITNMKKKPELIKTGWNIPENVRDEFAAFCTKVGSRIQEDCAGALVIWPYLPPQIREQAKLASKGEAQVDEIFWHNFRTGLELAVSARQGSPPKLP